jgi:hypothetical protein
LSGKLINKGYTATNWLLSGKLINKGYTATDWLLSGKLINKGYTATDWLLSGKLINKGYTATGCLELNHHFRNDMVVVIVGQSVWHSSVLINSRRVSCEYDSDWFTGFGK